MENKRVLPVVGEVCRTDLLFIGPHLGREQPCRGHSLEGKWSLWTAGRSRGGAVVRKRGPSQQFWGFGGRNVC